MSFLSLGRVVFKQEEKEVDLPAETWPGMPEDVRRASVARQLVNSLPFDLQL